MEKTRTYVRVRTYTYTYVPQGPVQVVQIMIRASIEPARRSWSVVGLDDEVLLALVELAGAGVDVLLELGLAGLEVAVAAAAGA